MTTIPSGYSAWTWSITLGGSATNKVTLELYSCTRCGALVWHDAASVQTHDAFHVKVDPAVNPSVTLGGSPI